MEEGLFHNQTFVQHVNEFSVNVVGHSNPHQAVAQRHPVSGEEMEGCPVYPGIPCQSHVDAYRAAGQRFNFRGTPTSFVCLPSGEKVAEIPGVPSSQKVIDDINAAQQRIGQRPVTGSQVLRMERDLYKGDQKLSQGKLADAREAYQAVASDEALPAFVRRKGEARLARWDAAARKAIEDARALPASRAKRELKRLVKELEDVPELKTLAEEALAAAEAG